jgi:phage terminase large subunit-like protein
MTENIPLPTENASAEEWAIVAERLRAEKERRVAQDRLGHYKPYPKQLEFHAAAARDATGAEGFERLFMAGNQLGKTYAGAAEAAMHLTGRYPRDWLGIRFDRPISMLAGSESGELTRDGVQRLLVGPPKIEAEWGTGYVPKDALIDWSRRSGVPDALDSITVKHISGGASVVGFKSYDQGRAKWQATTVDLVWFDEEPPEDVYSEGVTRTTATKGYVYLTYTPLLGMSNVTRRFLSEKDPHRRVTTMTIEDAEHFTPEERARIIARYPEHEREARARGVPILGSGRVFPIAESRILIPPFRIPPHWPVIGGLDFGWDHPTAAVKLAWDRENDVVYLIREHRLSKTTPKQHVATIGDERSWGAIPWAWPHDGFVADKGSGIALAKQYKAAGLKMLDLHAQFSNGSNSVEAGVLDMLERMNDGRWKVFDGVCPLWIEEFRLYHREDGKLIKEHEDLISASRYAMMMLRFARLEQRRRDPFGFGNEGRSTVALGTGEPEW